MSHDILQSGLSSPMWVTLSLSSYTATLINFLPHNMSHDILQSGLSSPMWVTLSLSSYTATLINF
ncbi:hypothetical protein J6590_080934, partial [Homalodisca vitripennis]